MVIYSKRHNTDLFMKGYIIIAPRKFQISLKDFEANNFFCIHICDFNCTYVDIFRYIKKWNDDLKKDNCFLYAKLKLYSNSKGLYFNFRYYSEYYDKYIIYRVYICE